MYKKIQPGEALKTLKTAWQPLKLCSVENYDVKLALFKGMYSWHKHAQHDEFIFVYKGKIAVDFKDSTVFLDEGEGVFVGKNTYHRSKAVSDDAVVILFEKNTIVTDFVRGDME